MKSVQLFVTIIPGIGLFLASAPLHSSSDLAQGTPANQRVINISAKRYAFTPTLVTIKKGETITIRLTSEDRIHGFYSKPLSRLTKSLNQVRQLK